MVPALWQEERLARVEQRADGLEHQLLHRRVVDVEHLHHRAEGAELHQRRRAGRRGPRRRLAPRARALGTGLRSTPNDNLPTPGGGTDLWVAPARIY